MITCPSCGHVHYLNSKVSASALVIERDRYLVVLRAREPERGKWDLPGGFCEYGESPDETARRETEEESGYAIEIVQLLGAWPDEYLEPDGSLWPTINLIYQARRAEGSTSTGNVNRSEVDDVRWAHIDNPPDDMAFPSQQSGALRQLAARNL